MNPLIQGKSGTTPVMSRNAFSTNQGTNEDDSQSDPHPEAGVFGNQTMRNFGQKDRRDNCSFAFWQITNFQVILVTLAGCNSKFSKTLHQLKKWRIRNNIDEKNLTLNDFKASLRLRQHQARIRQR